MRSVISLPASRGKSVHRCALSLLFNPSLVRYSSHDRLILRTMPDLMSEQTVSGAYFDIKVFNPNSSFYRMKKLPSLYRTHELQKRREYRDRITNIEYGSFSPLVFSSSGGMRPTASIVYRRLANLISSKHSNPYSWIILFIHCKLSFALLCSSLRCHHGSRSNSTTAVPSDINIDLALSEGKVSY